MAKVEIVTWFSNSSCPTIPLAYYSIDSIRSADEGVNDTVGERCAYPGQAQEVHRHLIQIIHLLDWLFHTVHFTYQ